MIIYLNLSLIIFILIMLCLFYTSLTILCSICHWLRYVHYVTDYTILIMLLITLCWLCHCVVPPRWTVEPADSSVAAGQDVILHCQADGYPSPVITWRKAVGMLVHLNYHITILYDGMIYILKVNNPESIKIFYSNPTCTSTRTDHFRSRTLSRTAKVITCARRRIILVLALVRLYS